MTDHYVRVRVNVTYTAEYLVEPDEYIETPENALEYIRSGLAFITPDEYRVWHSAELAEPMFWVDDNGDPLPEHVRGVAADWRRQNKPTHDEARIQVFADAYVQYVADASDADAPIASPADWYASVLVQLAGVGSNQ